MGSDDYARAVIKAGKDAGVTARGIAIGLATVLVETASATAGSPAPIKMWANSRVPESLALPHDAVGSDGFSVGLFQQQVVKGSNGAWWWGDAATCMDSYKSAQLFFERLKRLSYNDAGRSPGSFAQAVQQSAFPDRYDQRFADAQGLYARLEGDVVVDDLRPDFNEFAVWSSNSQSRNGKKVTAWLIHTQEGGGGDAAAENLAKWFQNGNDVSYHYTVSQASDGGVTVVDCVDTDLASWSVGNANNFTINLCFAGSKASWSRAEWLKQSKAIDVAAYLAVQDAKKYGFDPVVVAPPYASGTPGISDHRWVTQVYGWGTHTDVGDGFPWDVFAAAVGKYAGAEVKPDAPVIVEPKAKRFPDDWSDRDLLVEVLRQLRGPSLAGWPQLGGKTVVDGLSTLLSTDQVQA